MGFFNKEEEVKRDVPPVRTLTYRPTETWPKPYILKVGSVFPVKDGDNLEIVSILFSEEMLKASGKILYDVYVKKVGDNITFIWKTLPHRDNLDVEYLIDFD